MDELKTCYISGRDKSNDAKVSIDHKEPLVTEFSTINLKKDDKERRPYVKLTRLKSTNAVSLITRNRNQSNWVLINNVLPHVPVNRGTNLTSDICEGENGKLVTEKMANPGAKKKQIDTESSEDPKVIASQFKMRQKFIKRGKLENYLKNELNIQIEERSFIPDFLNNHNPNN